MSVRAPSIRASLFRSSDSCKSLVQRTTVSAVKPRGPRAASSVPMFSTSDFGPRMRCDVPARSALTGISGLVTLASRRSDRSLTRVCRDVRGLIGFRRMGIFASRRPTRRDILPSGRFETVSGGCKSGMTEVVATAPSGAVVRKVRAVVKGMSMGSCNFALGCKSRSIRVMNPGIPQCCKSIILMSKRFIATSGFRIRRCLSPRLRTLNCRRSGRSGTATTIVW